MPQIDIVVRQSVGLTEERCGACGRNHKEYVELLLRHEAKKIILCKDCDEAQLSKPRMVRH